MFIDQQNYYYAENDMTNLLQVIYLQCVYDKSLNSSPFWINNLRFPLHPPMLFPFILLLWHQDYIGSALQAVQHLQGHLLVG